MRFIRRWLSDCEGAAAVEAAMIVPILLIIVFGIIEMSMALRDYAVVASKGGAPDEPAWAASCSKTCCSASQSM